MDIGKKTWVFADGDLPPQGMIEPLGHEALMIVNNNQETARITLELLFEDKEPVKDIHIKVESKRANCVRMDFPIGEEKFEIGQGQYAVILRSDVPVICLYGRLDRRKDMAYYPIAGFSV